MIAFAIGMLVVPLADQALKFGLRRRLGNGSVSLGPLGSVRLVESQIWMARPWGCPASKVLWIIWLMSAAVLTLVTIVVPSTGAFVGLLLGGSFSHALETTQRGHVCDCFCLRFWPAFNAADICIVVGAIGLAVNLLVLISP